MIMITKAEELADTIAPVFHGAWKTDRQTVIDLLHAYGRLVQEAAAAHAEQQEYDCYGLCAKAIREMPLP